MWLCTRSSTCTSPTRPLTAKYEKGFFPLLKKYGGEFVTYDDAAFTLEGTSPRTGRMIIFTFPSEARARAWYADPEYQALSEHRCAGTRLEFLTMVRGLSQRQAPPPRTPFAPPI